jgi:hypothetical protein
MGGTGISSTITGQNVFYAGGGAGSTYQTTTNYGLPLGGAGGGGNGGYYNGSAYVQPVSGTANSGGGGGGGIGSVGGANGGSGIVIIRYPANLAPPTAVTGGPQILYNNGYQIYVFTSSGTITF